MSSSTWTLAVSTLLTAQPRVLEFLSYNQNQLAAFDEVLLICQRGPEAVDISIPASALPTNTRLIESHTAGISASRNAAIDSFRSDVVWFMDDDVRLTGNLSEIRRAICDSPAEINTLRIQDVASERLYKKYGSERDLGNLELLRVSSIEITCKKQFFTRTGLRFPEWIGIGTALPGGEENLFLRAARRTGARVRHLPYIACRHPVLAEGLKAIWSRPNRMRAMGIVARDCGAVGVMLCVRWSLRGLRAGVPRGRLADLWGGFFQGARLAQRDGGWVQHHERAPLNR